MSEPSNRVGRDAADDDPTEWLSMAHAVSAGAVRGRPPIRNVPDQPSMGVRSSPSQRPPIVAPACEVSPAPPIFRILQPDIRA